MPGLTLEEISKALTAHIRLRFEQDSPEAGQKASDNFIVWSVPGIPYQPEDLAFIDELEAGSGAGEVTDGKDLPDDGTDVSNVPASAASSMKPGDRFRLRKRQAMDFSVFVNFRPSEQNPDIYPGSGDGVGVSHIYETVLQTCRIATGAPLENEAQERITNALKVLDDKEISDKYDSHKAKVVEIEDKIIAERLIADAEMDLIKVKAAGAKLPRLGDDLRVAKLKWNSLGQKEKYEAALRDSALGSQSSLTKMHERAKERFAGATANFVSAGFVEGSAGIPFPYTTIFPTSFLKSDAGWEDVEFSQSLFTNSISQKSTRFGGAGAASFGLFTIAGGGGGKTTKFQQDSGSERFRIAFKVTKVPILRLWFDSLFLESRAWDLKTLGAEAAELFSLSNGNREKPEGKLIGYSTALLFAKDVTVESSDLESNFEKYEKFMEGQGGLSLGFLSLGAKGSQSVRTSDLKRSVARGKISIEGMQVIGFQCRLLNKVPNPLEEKDGVKFISV